MIRSVTEFYSYLFQEEDQVTAVYFSTNTGTEYRVYFYPANQYFDDLAEDTFLYKKGYFFGFTKLAPNEDKIGDFDPRVRNTILQTISDFFEGKGFDKILIFFCDNDDGKKQKRARSFDLWYKMSDTSTCFKKIDEEIVVVNENGEIADVDYMSLIFECDNEDQEEITMEFQKLKEKLIATKQ